MFFDTVSLSLDDGFVVPAVAYDGEQKRGAAVPEFRIPLPDGFFSSAVLIGDLLGANAVDDSGSVGIKDRYKHKIYLFSSIYYSLFLIGGVS